MRPSIDGHFDCSTSSFLKKELRIYVEALGHRRYDQLYGSRESSPGSLCGRDLSPIYTPQEALLG